MSSRFDAERMATPARARATGSAPCDAAAAPQETTAAPDPNTMGAARLSLLNTHPGAHAAVLVYR